MLRLKLFLDKMKKLNLYYLLFISSLILFFVTLFVNVEMTFDINIYDTYYIIKEKDFYLMLSFLLLFLALLYFILEKVDIKLSTIVSKLHILGTILLLLLFFKNQCFLNPISLSKRYYEISRSNSSDIYETIFYILGILILQLLFIINIFVLLIKKNEMLCQSQ